MGLYVVHEAFEQVVSFLASKGSDVRHDFGSEHLSELKETNCYVWVPTEITQSGVSPVGGADQHEALYETTMTFDVWCFGEDHNTSFALAQNVLHALAAVVPSACRRFPSAEFEFPKEGEPLMGNGRALVVHYGIAHSLILDVYTPVISKTRGVDQGPELPNAPFTTPTSVVITSSITSDIDVNGAETETDTVDD